jgi:hypothetical protein
MPPRAAAYGMGRADSRMLGVRARRIRRIRRGKGLLKTHGTQTRDSVVLIVGAALGGAALSWIGGLLIYVVLT